MSQIKARCVEQVLMFENTPEISSGNVNYDSVKFDFCSSWTGFTKTAIFYRNEDEVYYQLLDSSNTCIIPKEVLAERGVIHIGVFGVYGDKLLTSQVLSYRISQGAITENIKPADPTPDIYAQVISRYDAIIKELERQFKKLEDLQSQFDGAVGNADKLDGHDSSYFAPLESIGYFEKTVLLDASTTKIESLEQGVYRFSGANANLTDLPSGASTSTSNVHFLIVMANSTQKTYILTEPQSGKVWFGKTYGSGITWKEVASIADLENYFPKTGGDVYGHIKASSINAVERYLVVKNSLRTISLGVRANGSAYLYDDTNGATVIDLPFGENVTRRFYGTASGNLPLTGGTVKGSTYFKSYHFVSKDDASSAISYMQNSLRNVYQEVNGNGTYFLYDKTNSKSIIQSLLDGTNKFYGTATENLPLDGGGEVKGATMAPLWVKNTASNKIFTQYNGKDGTMGYLGFASKDLPVYRATDGSTQYALHHTGNSAKVHIGTSAPSDTSALWIDTSA